MFQIFDENKIRHCQTILKTHATETVYKNNKLATKTTKQNKNKENDL